MTSEQIYSRTLHFLKIATSTVRSVTNKKWISNNAIALIALLVSIYSVWENSGGRATSEAGDDTEQGSASDRHSSSL